MRANVNIEQEKSSHDITRCCPKSINYIKKEYTDVPIGTVIAIISALIYVLSPADIIPDGILGVGYLDDAAVVTMCWKLVKSDVEEYKRWRQMNGKVI